MNSFLALARLALVLLAVPALFAQDPPSSGSGNASAPGRYVISFTADVQDPAAFAGQLARQSGGSLDFVYRHALKGCAIGGLSKETAKILSEVPGVAVVQADRVAEPMGQSGAPWNLDRLDQRNLPVDGNYNGAGSGAGVTVYVVDSGLCITHDEFGGRASCGPSFVDDDFDGTMDQAEGFVHGTPVASIVGGVTAGVAKGVSIVGIRIGNATDGKSPGSAMIAAFDWVMANASHPAVVNLSYGTYGGDSLADEAAQRMIDSGITLCAAAGNRGTGPVDGGLFDPPDPADVYASHNSPARVEDALAVGATDGADQMAPWSCYGIGVDLLAPGVDCLAALPRNPDMSPSTTAMTSGFSGTSAATPHVAGAAALYLQAHPAATPDEVARALKAAATTGKIGSRKDPLTPDLLLYTGAIPVPAPPAPPVAPPVVTDPDAGWSDLPGVPLPVNPSGAIVSTDADTLFVATAVNQSTSSPTPFFRYTVSAQRWDRMANIPAPFKTLGAMVHPAGSNHIFLYPAEDPDRDLRFYRYSIASIGGETADAWVRLEDLPAPPGLSGSMTATSANLYFQAEHFYRFDLAKKLWSPLADFNFILWQPNAITGAMESSIVTVAGRQVVYPGSGDYLYRLRYGVQLSLVDRYQISTNQWNGYVVLPEFWMEYPPGHTHLPELANALEITAGPAGSNALYAMADVPLSRLCRYDIATGSWSLKAKVPTYFCLAAAAGTDDVFFMRSGDMYATGGSLWRYSAGQDRFLFDLDQPPDLISSGGTLAAVGNGVDLYALRGSWTRDFYHYSLATRVWTVKRRLPSQVGLGASLAYDGNGGMIAAGYFGSNQPNSWRYDIATDSWQDDSSASPLPESIGAGGQLIHVGGGVIFAMRGHAKGDWGTSPTYDFYRRSGGTWQAMASLPGPDCFYYGSSLAYAPDEGAIYAFTGTGSGSTFTTKLRRYSIAGNSWSAPILPDPPVAGKAASLCHPGFGRKIYALQGGASTRFSTFDLDSSTWSSRPDAPGGVGSPGHDYYGEGGALVHPGGALLKLFAFQGAYSSAFWSYDLGSVPTYAVSHFHGADLVFTATEGGSNPAPGMVQVWSNLDPVPWTATDDASWLSVQASGTVPVGGMSTIPVLVNISGLAVGTYMGTVTVSESGLSHPVTVTLTVTAPPVEPADEPKGGKKGVCGSVGFDVMLPLGILLLWRRLRR